MDGAHLQILDRAFYSELKSTGRCSRKLEELSRPSVFNSMVSVFINWAVIFASIELVFISKWFLPLALVIIGSRQRGLSNLVHDASHGNLANKKSTNEFLANIFCALPMFETADFYRNSHMKHHLFLGNAERDPDSKNHLRYGYNDNAPPRGNYFDAAVSLIVNRAAIVDSVFGSLYSLKKQDQLKITIWWALLVVALSFAISPSFALAFLALWLFTKISTYHLIRVTAEFLDHSGLNVGSKMSFSRTVSGFPLIRSIIHPNADNFHLVHHLLPRIPHYNLAMAHKELMSLQSYSRGNHCDGYAFGDNSAYSSWIGKERPM